MRALQIVMFLAVMCLMTWGLHHYIWARFVRDPEWPALWTRVGTWTLIAAGVMVPLGMLLNRALPRAVMAPIAWAVFSWMGLAFFLFLGLATTDGVRVLMAAVSGAQDPERRRFMARLMASAVGVTGIAAGLFAMRTALAPWTIRTVRVRVSGLPEALRGMRIVQLTDVHVGPTIGRDFIRGMVRAVNRLNPDVVAITGDLVDGPVSELGAHVAPLADLRAKHGTFFVTGNHEYYSGVAEWVAELGRLGVRVLDNERVTVGEGEHVIDLAGVNDWSARRFDVFKPDLAKALHGRDSARPVVLLAHQPKIIKQAAEARVDLVLSGHTHGGQIWPWSKLVALDQPYLAGLHREEHTQIYVSEGTGYWGPPMRVGTAPEITEIILDRA